MGDRDILQLTKILVLTKVQNILPPLFYIFFSNVEYMAGREMVHSSD